METDRDLAADRPLASDELRRRALGGSVLMMTRGVVARALALAGTVVLARLLSPVEFGQVAIGVAIILFGTLVSDGGIGVALIRRPQSPQIADLRALSAVQLPGTALLAAIVAGVGLALGGAGAVTAAMMPALPVLALRAPGMIVLQRDVSFRPIAAAEMAEQGAYWVWAVSTVALGLGVWGFATASIAGALVGTAVVVRSAPVGLLWPAFDLNRVRGLLGFGIRFNSVGILDSVRDQGVSLGTAIIAGTATLGIYSLAWRLIQVPFLLFQALWQVSYPAMARLISAGEDPAPVIERTLRITCVGAGVLLTAMAGSAPALIPAVFGEQWQEAAIVIPPAALGLLVGGPISVAMAGFLFATGDVRAVLRNSVVQIFLVYSIGFVLLATVGIFGIGIGWLCGAIGGSIVLARATFRRSRARVRKEILVPVSIGIVAAGTAWLIASELPPTIPTAVLSAAVGPGLYLAGLAIFHRALLLESAAVTRRAVRSGLVSSAP